MSRMRVGTAMVLCVGVVLVAVLAFAAPGAVVVTPQQGRTSDTGLSDAIAASRPMTDSPAAIVKLERSPIGGPLMGRTAGLSVTLMAAGQGRFQSHGCSSASPGPRVYSADTSLFSLHCKLAI